MSEIIYHEKESLPGKKFFSCNHGMGVISVPFCAEAHLKANTKEFITEFKRQACRHCAVGACHANKRDTASGSRLYSSLICARCERWSSRLIGKGRNICICCYNRQAEVEKGGKNAKGNPLKKIRKYRDIPILVIKNAQVELSVKKQVMSLPEAIIGTLVSTSEACSFAWVGPAVQTEIDFIVGA